MSTSRHATLSAALVSHLMDGGGWPGRPSNVTIVRAYDYVHLLPTVASSGTCIVAVMTPRIATSTSSRRTDRDTIPVFTVLLAGVADTSLSSVDPWDVLAESMRDSLRSRALAAVDLGGGAVARRVDSVSLPTPYDADYLDGSNIFLATAESEYTISVEVDA